MNSKHFSNHEIFYSYTAEKRGIRNDDITPSIAENILRQLDLLEKVRDVLGVPMTVTSFYRCVMLNSVVSKQPNSYHIKGLATDFIAPKFGSCRDIWEKLQKHKSELAYDQLILEYKDGKNGDIEWIHIQTHLKNKQPRLESFIQDYRKKKKRGKQ